MQSYKKRGVNFANEAAVRHASKHGDQVYGVYWRRSYESFLASIELVQDKDLQCVRSNCYCYRYVLFS